MLSTLTWLFILQAEWNATAMHNMIMRSKIITMSITNVLLINQRKTDWVIIFSQGCTRQNIFERCSFSLKNLLRCHSCCMLQKTKLKVPVESNYQSLQTVIISYSKQPLTSVRIIIVKTTAGYDPHSFCSWQ